MRAAIYIRVSTEEQAKEGYSISAQRERLKAYCIAQDWTVASFYVDEGISAKDMKRPQLQQMIKDIEKGEIDCVLVYRLDRLTRSVLDLYQLLEIFEKHDCKFKSATEVYDTTTAMGRMFITIVAALAQWERENLGERVSMGFAEKARQGKYPHNIEPFGYHLNLEEGTLSINDEEAKLFKFIVDLYLKKGYGANRICKYLNGEGIATKGGNHWNDKPLMQMLKNPLYKGTIKWGDVIVENAVPAIIDDETFEQIQLTIERRRSTEPRQVGNDYIFSSVYKCSCGHTMVGFKAYHKNSKGQKVVYKNYRCFYKKLGQCNGNLSVSEIKLEKAFVEYLEGLDFTSVLDEVAVTGTNYLNNHDEAKGKKEDLEKELEKIEKRKKKWQYAWVNEMITDDDFSKRMEEDKVLEEKLKEQLEALQPYEVERKINASELYQILKDFSNNWYHLTIEEKKSFVQLVVKEIHVKHESRNSVVVEHVDFY